MEFPRLVYRKNGKEVIHECANDEKQFDSLIESGWFENVPDAMIGKKEEKQEEVADENAPPTRAELEAQAKNMGIKFDGRTSDAKLLAAIEAGLKE